MKQKICRTCGSVMKKETNEEGVKYFCKKCDAFTEFDEMEMEPYCPTCGEKISSIFQCCSLSFFCSKCEAQITASKIVWKK
jgi:DNA-directed RNA polymerase subunit RPC12/RpoP